MEKVKERREYRGEEEQIRMRMRRRSKMTMKKRKKSLKVQLFWQTVHAKVGQERNEVLSPSS
jgi:hypothetical protein